MFQENHSNVISARRNTNFPDFSEGTNSIIVLLPVTTTLILVQNNKENITAYCV